MTRIRRLLSRPGAVVEIVQVPRGDEPPPGYAHDAGVLCHHDHYVTWAYRLERASDYEVTP